MGLGAADYARMLVAHLPPGRAFRLVGGVLRKLLDGIAEEFARVDARATDLLRESLPSKAVELLPEYETDLGIAAGTTNAERQSAIVSRLVARQRYRPVDLAAALAPLLAIDAEELSIIETSVAQAAATGDPRNVYTFFVLRDWSAPGTYYLDRAQKLLDAIAPAHTRGLVIETNQNVIGSQYAIVGRTPVGG